METPSGSGGCPQPAARCHKPPLKREEARTELVSEADSCAQPPLHNASVSSGSESGPDTQPVESQPGMNRSDSEQSSQPLAKTKPGNSNSRPGSGGSDMSENHKEQQTQHHHQQQHQQQQPGQQQRDHQHQQHQQPSVAQRSSGAMSGGGEACGAHNDAEQSENPAKRPKTKRYGYGYGYGKAAETDAGSAQGMVGYTYDTESGWYFNNTDPTWLYSAEQHVHFHTATQQYYVTGEDGTLVPYTTPAESAHVPAAYRCDKLTVSSSMRCMQGRRPTQEDRHTVLDGLEGVPVQPCAFYGVYDGHCGVDASTYCEEHLHHHIVSQLQALSTFDEEGIKAAITQAVEGLDKSFLQLAQRRKRMDGSCVLAACVFGTKLFTAHLGDSRAVLCRDNAALRLTEDHKPEVERERQRILAAGGRVLKVGTVYRATRSTKEDNVPQVMLAVARSIGDLKLKVPQAIVSATPDTNCYDLQPHRDSFVVLCCDGVWDVLSDSDVVNLILDRHRAAVSRTGGSDPGALQHGNFTAADAASLVVKTAFERGSNDNISVIVVTLKWAQDSTAVGARERDDGDKASSYQENKNHHGGAPQPQPSKL